MGQPRVSMVQNDDESIYASEYGSYMTHEGQRVGGFSGTQAASLNEFLYKISPNRPTETEQIAKFIQCYGSQPEAVVIPMIVEGEEVPAMIDDGATITVASKRFADLMQASGKATIYPATETVKVFGGATVKLSEKIDLNMGTHKQTAKCDVWISDEVPFDLCIGFNFARPNKFIVDLEDMTVTMFGKAHGETTLMMNNTQLLSKLSQINQAIHARDFRSARTPSTSQ